MNTSLNAARRAREFAELGSGAPVDVLVIGGGITGAGVALDAASRGLTVVLAEKHDLAFGTSRWSSKLVHGGLRYLAAGHVGIAYESAVERGILMQHTAPHLVRALPQVLPLGPDVSHAQAIAMRAGLLAADTLRACARTPRTVLPGPRPISASEVRRHAPTVRCDAVRGGLLGWDGQLCDDARLVVAVARTAAGLGARILTRCNASQVTGRGAMLCDELTGECLDVAARTVINATGVWASQIAPGIALRPSRGTHLVLPQDSFGELSAALTVPVPGARNRFVFALPAPDRRVYVGITDEEAPGPVPDVPEPTDAEIDFLLATISSLLIAPLRRSDLLGAFAGLRPLLDTGTGGTADISRRHRVILGSDALVTVVGGKLTTYRRMAQDAVDAALRQAGIQAPPCRTRRLPLVGAASRARLETVQTPRRLVDRYGTEAVAVLAEAHGDPALLRPITADTDTTGAELRFAIRHEGALDEADLLDRRTRIGLSCAARDRALPHAAAALLYCTA